MIKRLKNLRGETVFKDEGGGAVYRRIVGALGWPQPGQPGFLVVLGENIISNEALKGRPLEVLAERQDDSLEGLHRGCLELRHLWAADRWLADLHQEAALRIFKQLNRELAEGKRLWLSPAPYSEPGGALLTLYQLLAAVSHKNRKLLKFGEGSSLAAAIGALNPEEMRQPASRYPAAAALGYAVAEMVLREPMSFNRKGPQVQYDRVPANWR